MDGIAPREIGLTIRIFNHDIVDLAGPFGGDVFLGAGIRKHP
jgi:hypothetical protein